MPPEILYTGNKRTEGPDIGYEWIGSSKEVRKARERIIKNLQKQYKAGHAEALEINEQYEELINKANESKRIAAEAEDELKKFERDKLGMDVNDIEHTEK